jgi:hypothetical protein
MNDRISRFPAAQSRSISTAGSLEMTREGGLLPSPFYNASPYFNVPPPSVLKAFFSIIDRKSSMN